MQSIHHKNWKRLSAVILAAMGVAVSFGSPAMAANYTDGLTGVVAEDQDIIGDDGNTVEENKSTNTITYDFKGKDHTFTVKNQDGIGTNTDKKHYSYVFNNVDKSGNKGTLHINQTNTYSNAFEGVTGFSASNGDVTVNSHLDITAYSAYASTGISAGMGANLTINGNVTMRKNDTENPWGIVTKNVHGNVGPGGAVSMDGGVDANYTGARWNPAGLSVGNTGGSITVNGDVDIAVRGTAVRTDAYGPDGSDDSYNYAVINLLGDTIHIDTPVKEENEVEGFGKFIEPYYSLATYGGTINVNVKDQEARDGTVQMVGNVIAMKRSAFTEANDKGNYLYQNGRINLGLTTAESSWQGLIDNAGTDQAGEVNLWLKNGAQWIYENASRKDGLDASNLPELSRPAYKNYDGTSHLNRLVGASSADTAGIIQIKESAPIEITSVEGTTKIWYDHADATPGTIIGGDVKVLGAKAGAQMMLYTGNNGITKGLSDSATAADRNMVSAVLNELAHKLWYMAGDTNLTGTVNIAEGLTAGSASASLRSGNISFSTADTGTKQVGQGFYDYTPEQDTKTYETGAIKKSENIDETRESDINGVVTIHVTEKQEGAAGGPSALFVGTDAESPMTVDLQGHTLVLSTGSANNSSTIYVDDGKELHITDSKGTGKVKVSAGLDTEGNAEASPRYIYGIGISDEGIFTADTDVEIDGVKTQNTRGAYGLYTGNSGKVVFNKDLTIKNIADANSAAAMAAGIYLNSSSSGATGSTVTIKGNLDIENVYGSALRVQNGSVLNTAGGIIKAKDMTADDTNKQYYALQANKGTINLNTGDGITAGIIDVTGDMKVTDNAKSVINVNLTNGSKWTGAAINKSSGTYNPPSGQLNLSMADGSSWIHETGRSSDTFDTGFVGSNISKLHGTGGVIYQNSDKAITVYNYSGDTTVVYQHDADNPLSMIGGDFNIKAADAGSTITLMTDSKGISGGFSASDTAAERNHVKEILNKLAQKLTYTGYTDGHVTGVVKIASGLTASEVKAKGDITFSDGTNGTKTKGQGFYDYTPEKPSYRTGAISTSEDISLTREPDEAGVIHVKATDVNADNKFISALYASESADYSDHMKVQMNGKGLALDAESDAGQVAGIYVSTNKYIDVINPSSDQVLSITATNTDTRGAHGIYMLGNAHLNITGSTEIKDVVTKGDSATGINMHGQQSDLTIDGSLKISNVKGMRGRGLGLNASGILVTGDKSSVTVTGPVDISEVYGAGIKLQGADTKVSVGGGTITAAKDEDKSHNYYAARVDKGQLDINMKDGQAASTTTKITGDLFVTGQYGKKVVEYSGGELIDWAAAGVMNVALMDKDSFWTGAAVYDQYTSEYGTGGSTVHDIGQLNLYLQNGATWTNEIQSHGTTTTTESAEWAGSTLASLHGGSDADHAGVIYQKDGHPISVVDYSGYTEVHYEHDTSDPTSIIGGDFKITNAAEGSSITLTTSREGISDDEALITKVLNGLAGKLYDKSYADGNLVGIVKIAAGLTASEVTERINFSTNKVGTGNEGQGYYKLDSTDPGEEGQTETNFTQAIFGVAKHDTQYVDAKVRQNDGTYRFTKDSTITIDAKDGYETLDGSENTYTFDLQGRTLKNRSAISAIANASNAKINIDATDKTLDISLAGGTYDMDDDSLAVSLITAAGTKDTGAEVTINTKELNLSMPDRMLSELGFGSVGFGIYADDNGKVTINGDVNLKNIDGMAISVGQYGGGDGNDIFSQNAVTINGDLNITGAGAGLNIAGGNSQIIVSGKTTIADMASEVGGASYGPFGVGILRADDDALEYISDNATISLGTVALQLGEGNTALRADKGTINVNTGVEGTTAGTTSITGNVITNGGHINLALNDENSYLKGRIQATSGTVDITLADKATWFNEGTISGTVATHMNSLSGEGGLIYQNGTDDIQIDNYKGEHYVFYAHDESNPTTIIGGDIRIAKTDGSAKIHLITDSKGIKAGFNANDTAENQNMVSEVLNKLAQKVFYTANDGHLFGTVKIASGLTLSESYLKEGILSFSDGTTGTGTAGQGYFSYTPVDDSIITAKITGGNDTKYVNMGIETDKGIYKFTKDSTIHVTKGSYSSELGAIESSNGPIVIDADGKALDVSYTVEEGSNVARGVATGMSSGQSKDISIKAGKLNLASKTSGWRAQGVYAAGGTITIDADTTISTSASTETNGIYAGSKGKVTMNGDLTINDDNTTGTYYALKADNDGIINVNLKDDKAAEDTVQLKGDIFTQSTESYDWEEDESTTTSSTINLALKGKDSNWTGRSVYSVTGGDDSNSYGNFNLWLEDGAIWTNQASKNKALNGFNGSHVTNFHGQGGYIAQNDTSAISLDHYSGDTTVIYKHEVKENTERENASDYGNQEVSIIGGDFKIAKAQADSNITLVTDRAGLNTDSNKAVDQNLISDALNKLANKLFYTANDGNLKGKVQIASGLTASEVTATLKSGDISFKDDGQGYYDYKLVVRPDHQTETKFTTAITGDAAQDEYYAEKGVLKDDGSYVFTENATIITPEKHLIALGAWMPMASAAISGADADHNVTIDMKGNKLTIDTTTDTHTTGIAAIGDGVVEVNDAGSISINAESTKSGQTAALYVNGGGTIKIHNDGDDNVLTLRAKSMQPANAAVIKATNGKGGVMSSVTIDGLVDILADKSEASGANEAISAVASKVEIGGGTIKALNGASYAIRAYGEFASTNRATVNVNVKKDADGNIIGAGNNQVQMEGDVFLGGGMDQGGAKADVTVGLNTKDSYWKGNVGLETFANGSALGIYNLYMGNGATWTGNNVSQNTVNANLDGGASWTGHNTGNAMHLTLNNGAFWNVDGDSNLASFTGKDGLIHMDGDQTGTVNITDYSGDTTVIYKHEIVDDTNRDHASLYGDKAASIFGGDVKITNAAEGSTITLVTDRAGLNLDSTLYSDKNLVNDVLDKLANKLFYTNYADGHLVGYVKIAEGLTASSITRVVKSGDISYREDGQGYYDYDVIYPTEQVKDPMNTVIDGSESSKDTYREAGIYNDANNSYQFTKDPSTIESDGNSTGLIEAKDNDVNVVANKTLKLKGKDGGVGILAEAGKTSKNDANMDITVNDGTGILANAGHVEITGNVTIEAKDSSSSDITVAEGKDAVKTTGEANQITLQTGMITGNITAFEAGNVEIKAGTGMEAKNGGTITIGGRSDITVAEGKDAVKATGEGSQIILKTGMIKGNITASNSGKVSTDGADIMGDVNASSKGDVTIKAGTVTGNLLSDGGTISTNETTVTGNVNAKSGSVDMISGRVTGDVNAAGGKVSMSGTHVTGRVNAIQGGEVAMTNGNAAGITVDKDSKASAAWDKKNFTWTGDVDNAGDATISFLNGASWTGDSKGDGNTNITIGKDSTWTGQNSNVNTDLTLEGTWKETGESQLKSLAGQGGALDMTSNAAGNTTIGTFSGSMRAIYKHDEAKPTNVQGGIITVNDAAEGAKVDLITDSKGLKLSSNRKEDKDTVSETLNQLAHKLIYKGETGKLTGTIGIAEGLTSTSATLHAENISFDGNGMGQFKYDPAKSGIIIEYSSEETRMMQGTKSSLLGTAMMWRTNNNDLLRRMGDLRLNQGETGAWARYVGGKNKFDQQHTYLSQSYNIAQVGYDKKVGDWSIGLALDHGNGKNSFIGGKAKEKMTTLAFYGSKVSDDGSYIDIILKTGKVSNKFDVSNEVGNRLHSDYDTWGNSLSVEYGKRFTKDDGFYLDPSVEFTMGRLNSKTYIGTSDLGELQVRQHAFDSAIGRIGLSLGKETPRSNVYAKLALAHEFGGAFKTDFYADDGGLRSTRIDLSDTWLDMELGGTLKLGERTSLYGNFTRSFASDVTTKWRVDAGVRFTF